jgi:hypothetical protein
MEESKKKSGMRTFGWLNGGLLTLLVGLCIVFKFTTITSSGNALSTVLFVLFVTIVANAFLFLKALWQRQFLLAVLCLLVAGGFCILLGGILGGIAPGSLGK